MSKHTPGIWFLDDVAKDDVYRYIISESGFVCRIDLRQQPSKEIAEANARLIAAAPELLKALIEILERLENHPSHPCDELTEEQECEIGGDTAEFSYLVRIGKQAIAKATGAAA